MLDVKNRVDNNLLSIKRTNQPERDSPEICTAERNGMAFTMRILRMGAFLFKSVRIEARDNYSCIILANVLRDISQGFHAYATRNRITLNRSSFTVTFPPSCHFSSPFPRPVARPPRSFFLTSVFRLPNDEFALGSLEQSIDLV